eukprot:1562074-Amphidinium_carterae.1
MKTGGACTPCAASFVSISRVGSSKSIYDKHLSIRVELNHTIRGPSSRKTKTLQARSACLGRLKLRGGRQHGN